MDDINSKLLSLTDQELMNYLRTCEGYDGTPVTPSTRMLLVRKLTRNLLNNSNADDAVGCVTSRKNYPSTKTFEDDSTTNEFDLKQSSDCSNGSQTNSKQIYYGVHVPSVIDHKQPTGTGKSCVFTDKKEVFKFMKDFPAARFKVFQTRKEAEDFTKLGGESSIYAHETTVASKINDSSILTGEKTSTFKAPKPQELVQLRKAIERGDAVKFIETVWKNPRYLVGSGDTPTILQEGSRYNALHVASKAGNATICEAILETVSKPSFIRLLYYSADELLDRENDTGPLDSSSASVPKQEDQAILDCIAYLLDLYLNTPEKGLNETPLHFASKFGKVDAVKVLVSYPMCDRTRLNKLGETPEEIICSRCDRANEGDVKKIRQLIRDRFYVPVLRPEDLCQQASIGEPFSPEKAPISSPESKRDPKSPLKEINAYAGPMSLEEAWTFCKKWKSPLKAVNGKISLSAVSPSHRGLSSPSSSCSSSPLRLCDPDRGLEREGRALANELQVGWMEYWPFLGAFANFTTKEGMKILEDYFRQKLQDACKLKRQSKQTIDNGNAADAVGKQEAVSKSPDNVHVVTQEITPVTELCHAMESCTLSSGRKTNDYPNKPLQSYGCTNLVEPSSFVSPSPLQYVEKSCRIFARRISDSLIREAQGHSKRVATNSIGPEVHHLRRLVSSFKEDSRFSSIDFSHMHCRVSSLAADGVLETMSSSDAAKVMDALVCIPTTLTYICSSSDEEDDKCLEKECDSKAGGREWRISMRHSLHKSEGFGFEEEVEHVQCLMALIKEALEKRGLSYASPCGGQEEGDAIEAVWAKTKSCSCTWSNPNTLHHHSKVSSRASLAAVCRRLSFENSPNSENQLDISLDLSSSWKNQNPSNSTAESVDCKESFAVSSEIYATEDADLDDVFYTPPSSPTAVNSPVSSDDEDEIMEDTEEMIDIFIEGNRPTKLDLDVLYALEDSEKINPLEFPYIYQWKNLVLTHSIEERASWLSPHAPRWRKQTSFMAETTLEKSSRHTTFSPSMVFSSRHQQYGCSPLAETPATATLR